MKDRTGQTLITISDRNKAAFLVALGHKVSFEPDSGGRLNFQFYAGQAFYEASEAYSCNAVVPVMNFVTAQRQLTDAIHDYRQRIAVRR